MHGYGPDTFLDEEFFLFVDPAPVTFRASSVKTPVVQRICGAAELPKLRKGRSKPENGWTKKASKRVFGAD
jgi:hypothetical protein